MSQVIDLQFIDKLQAAFHEGDENVAEKSKEAENVRRVEEVFRIIANKDFDSLKNFLAEDVTLEIIGSPSTPWAGFTQGREKVIEQIRNNFAQIEEQQEEIRTVVAQGDTVIIVGREQGRFRPTGRSYELHWMHQYTFRHGKIVRMRELLDSAALLDVIKSAEE
jgi:uncharacterized protein